MTTATGEVTYLVLADRGAPYLLARVRWPDVAQAITVGRPDWLDDPGLFDLPYDLSAMTVSFPQAAAIAAAWGTSVRREAVRGAPSFIRRMPANWSDLTSAERRAFGIESVGKRRAVDRFPQFLRPLRSAQATVAAAVSANGDGPDSGVMNAPDDRSAPHRRQLPPRVNGRAHIRCGRVTICAGLADLGESGMQCVLPEAHPRLAPGTALDGPFLLEAEARTTQLCLDVQGWISWQRFAGPVTHFGVRFGELSEAQTEGLRRFLATAVSRGSR